MRHWFQNLNENKTKWFHFRGAINTDKDYTPIFKYEVCSGPSLSIRYSSSEDGPMLSLGLLLIKLYLTSRYFKIPFLTYGRQYGFYFYHWDFCWSWGTKEFEFDSRTPKWRQFTFHIDEFFLGRWEALEHNLTKSENIKFKIGGKEFLMNSIEWKKRIRFRRHIPFTLYNNPWISVEMKIDKPPMRAGKGENSWDCDNDGSFGLSMPWNHKEIPRWDNTKACNGLAVKDYVDSVLKDAKRYGSGDGDRGIKHSDTFEYIGEA